MGELVPGGELPGCHAYILTKVRKETGEEPLTLTNITSV